MKLIIKVALMGVFAFALNTNVFAQGECLGGGCSSAGTNFPLGTLSTTSSTFTTVSATTWGGDYSLYNVTAGNTYEWSMCAADGGTCSWDSELTLYNNAALGVALCYSDDFCGDDAKISWTATFTGVVRVKLNVFGCVTNSVNATLRWRCASCSPACTNDDCATAIPLATTGATYCGTNSCGTLGGAGDFTMSCTFAGDATQGAVWFSFVAPASGSVTITTDYAGTDFDTQLNLLGDLAGVSSSCPAVMYEYGCSEDDGVINPLASTIVIGALVPGQTYWIQLDGYAGDVGNYCISVTTNPCLANVGTFGATVNGTPISISTPVYLCFGPDCYTVTSNNDYVLPSANCGVSELMYAIYTSAPTVTDPNLDPAWTGYYWTGEDFSDCNNGASVFNTVPTLTGFTTYWLVPITADDGDNDDAFCPGLGHDNNGDGCFDVGAPIEMHYLNAIVGSGSMNSCTGVATIAVTGGLPQDNGSNYTITNTGPGTMTGTPISHGGSVTISGLTNGQTVTLTITDGRGCSLNYTFGPVSVTTPSTAAAGTDQSICASPGTVTMAGNTPTVGTGAWSLVSGPSAVTITTASSPTTTITGLTTAGTYVFQWTISNAACTPSTDQVSVVVTGTPTTANAGPNQTICATSGSVTMAGNVAAVGTGTWTYVSGPVTGTITTPSSPTTTITGLTTAGTYVYQWSIANAPCASSTSTVTITVNAAPTTANAGPNQTICATSGSVTMAGNVAAVGTGTWTYVSGPVTGTITTPSSPTTTITGLTTAGTYVYQWSIANAPCASSSSTVTITVNAAPTTANAGSNQTICTSTGSATMSGNTPAVGTGTWTYVSGPVTGTITTPTSPTTTITGLTTAGTYVYQWTIANAPCASSSSTVTITVNAPPTIANSGAPQTICATSGTVTMAGNAPGIGTATWSQISGPVVGTITTPTSPTTTITGLTTPGAYVFQWSIINPPCSPSTSNVTITVNPAPTTSVAGPAQTICSGIGSVTMAANVVVTGTGVWTQVSGPSAGTITTPSSPTTTITGLTTAGTYVFQWTISNAPCSPSSSTVAITVNPNPVFAIGTVANPSGCGLTDGSITLTGLSASTTYTISYNSGSTVSLGSVTTNASGNYVITGLGAGTYSTFSVTNSFGCTTIVAGPASLVDPSAPTGIAGSASTNPTTCGGTNGTITISGLTPGGTYDITYSVGATIVSLTGLTADASGNIILTGLSAGTYSGFSLAQSGCTGSATGSVTLSDPASPSFTSGATFTNPTACGASDGTITISGLTASTTYTLSYDGPSGTVIVGSITTTGAGTYVITGLSAGAYTNFVITNATACSTTSATIVTLSDPASPTFSAGTTSTNPTTCGGSDGTITITGLNPSTTYIISYEGPSGVVLLGSVTTTATGTYVITGLPAGSYFNFTVSLSGCSTVDAITVINLTDPGSPTFTITGTGTNPTGCGLTDGTFDITGLTPFTTYDFSYDNGSVVTVTGTTDASGNYTVTGLGAGTYTNISVTITGCTSTNSTTVTLVDPGGPVFSISGTGTNPTTCLGTDGTITLTGLTPSTVYDITYFDGTSTITLTGVTTDASGNYIITGLSAGTYSAITVILTGCSGTNPTPVTLTDPGAPTSFTISGTNPSCSSNDGVISITGLTPSTSYIITYFDGTSTITVTLTTDATGQLDITALAAGTYSTFTVSTGGCTATPVTTITLTTPTPQTALAGSDQTICGTTSIMAGNAVTAGTGTWTVIAGTGTFVNANSEVTAVSGLSTGTNTFVWTIVNGSCPVSSDTVTINSEVPPTVASVGADVVLCDSATTMTAYANIPTVGTGVWTVSSGSVTISNPLADSVNVSAITGPFTLTWTITGTGICPPTSDDLIVTIDPCVDLDISTGFTPDGDGINDTWIIPGLTENYPNCRVEIFTRWGAKIFTSDGYTTPWDGKYKNNNMPLGAYFFVIYFNDGATDPAKGTITIIR